METMKTYAPSVLRYSLALVMLWFGIQQLINTANWTAYVPDSIVTLTHVSATTLVYFNAVLELVLGILLVFGVWTRWVALILALHLFDIIFTVGYGEIAVRDFGLAMACIAIFMHGADPLCVEYK